jgi:uncharacterized repeat protein (TIGR01451 family)
MLANPAPTSITPDSIVWALPLLSPYQSGNIQIDIIVSVIPIGTVIHSTALVLPVVGDANPGCNNAESNAEVTGAVDPNDITVDRDSIFNFELVSPPYLEYTIRFQNTGNDTAFYVAVLNNIPEELDLSTFQITAASHPLDINFTQNPRLIEFHFPNILLPDSNINEPLSHGFIRYRIKPKSTLVAGDSISNFAAIYFDFNAPVITNTAVTQVVLPTGGEEIADIGYLKVFPNPAADKIIVVGGRRQLAGGGGQVGYEILDMLGAVVQSGKISHETENEIDISSLNEGVYLIRLLEGKDGEVRLGRFVKM